jgi:hypothetical protein
MVKEGGEGRRGEPPLYTPPRLLSPFTIEIDRDTCTTPIAVWRGQGALKTTGGISPSHVLAS